MLRNLTISILIAIAATFFARKGRKVLQLFAPFKMLNSKPFTCAKCMGFWLSVLIFGIIDPLYILPSYLISIWYDNGTFE